MQTQIVRTHWRELLRDVQSSSVDLIATDPPYSSLRRWEGVGTTGRMGLGAKGTNADDPDKLYPTISNSDLPELLGEFHRVLKPNCHCYVMCDNVTLPYIFEVVGFGPHDATVPFTNCKPLIWDKVSIGMGYHYRSRYEFVILLDKGKNRRLRDLGVPDVLEFKADKPKLFPTQKPVALFETLIAQSTEPGELVVDPFIGSGTTAVASAILGRRFLGGDIDRRAIEITEKRLEALSNARPNGQMP